MPSSSAWLEKLGYKDGPAKTPSLHTARNMMQPREFLFCVYIVYLLDQAADRDVILTSLHSHFATFCFFPLELWPLAHKKIPG